jgi:hypothetical protein
VPSGEAENTNVIAFWFDPTVGRTHDLAHTRASTPTIATPMHFKIKMIHAYQTEKLSYKSSQENNTKVSLIYTFIIQININIRTT